MAAHDTNSGSRPTSAFGSGQTVENFTSPNPGSSYAFGAATAAANITGGRDWVIIGEPVAIVNGVSGAGKVWFFPPTDQPTQAPFAITAPSGYVQADAHFGAQIVVADFNLDGIPDVVVGAPHWDNGIRIHEGKGFIFYGPWSPLAQPPYASVTVLEVHPFDVDTANPTHGGMFSYSLAVGNLDNTGSLDLVVGAPRADRIAPPVIYEAGAIDIFPEPSTGSSSEERSACPRVGLRGKGRSAPVANPATKGSSRGGSATLLMCNVTSHRAASCEAHNF
jgi:hypothetical protein